MAEAGGRGWARRDFIGGAALLALALGVPAAGVALSDIGEDEAPSDRQFEMMRSIAQHVIPATETMGAGDVGVGAFVLLALAHGLEGTRNAVDRDLLPPTARRHLRRDGSLRHADWIEAELDHRTAGDWLSASAETQRATLAQLDAEAFARDAGNHPWKSIKSLVLVGYYTSEEGGARELRYDPVPGRFDPAVSVTPEARAYSNDWTGVEFG